MGDDIEAALRRYLDGQIRSKVDGVLSGDLLDLIVVTIQAELARPISTDIDLRFTTSANGFTAPDEPPGAAGAIRADAHVEADIRLNAMALGVGCNNISGHVEVDLRAHAWARSAGDDTGITPKLDFDVDSSTDLDMPLVAWANPVCVLAWGASWTGIGEFFLEDGVVSGLNGAFNDSVTPACLMNRSIFRADGTLVNPSAGIPEQCIARGSIKRLLEGFDLAEYLPSVTLAGTTIKPLVTDIDNSWCLAPGAPPGCTPDQSLIGRNGVGVVGDTTVISSLQQALGGPLGGRFRNVFSPTVSANASALATTHRDASGRPAALGVVVDPRLVNLAMRHLAQGGSTTRETDGLLDIDEMALPSPGWHVSVRPEVAPQVLGVPPSTVCSPLCPPTRGGDSRAAATAGSGAVAAAATLPPGSRALAAVNAPDLRVQLAVGPNSGAPIDFSVGVSVNAGAGFDGRTGETTPVFDTPQFDVQVTGNCKVNYGSAYFLAYTVCGRGQGGAGARDANGNPISLTDLISLLANQVAKPVLDETIGSIELPSLDGIVPGLNVSLTNVRFDQRGGFLGLYGDLKPTPRVAIAPSVDATRQFVRFFPSQLSGVDVSLPTTWTWELVDGVTGQPVAATVIAGTGNSAVQAPLDAFAEAPSFYTVPGSDPPVVIPTNMGPEKTVNAKLTVRQADLEIVATAVFKWHRPTPVPPNPCSTGGTVPLGFAAAAAPQAPPGPGQPPGC